MAGGESCTDETSWLARGREQPEELTRTGAIAAVAVRDVDPLPPNSSAIPPPSTTAASKQTDKTPIGADQKARPARLRTLT